MAITPGVHDALTGPLITHLAGALRVPVVGQTPNPQPGAWMLVERVGGVTGGRNTDYPMVSIETWAPTKAEASELAHHAWRLLTRDLPPLIGGVRILRRVPVSGSSYQPVPSSGDYRYRCSVQIKHHVMKEGPP